MCKLVTLKAAIKALTFLLGEVNMYHIDCKLSFIVRSIKTFYLHQYVTTLCNIALYSCVPLPIPAIMLTDSNVKNRPKNKLHTINKIN